MLERTLQKLTAVIIIISFVVSFPICYFAAEVDQSESGITNFDGSVPAGYVCRLHCREGYDGLFGYNYTLRGSGDVFEIKVWNADGLLIKKEHCKYVTEIMADGGTDIEISTYYGNPCFIITAVQGWVDVEWDTCEKFQDYESAYTFLTTGTAEQSNYYFTTSAGSTTLADGDKVSCAFSRTKGNLDGDSFSTGSSCPVLRWKSSDENVVKVTDNHAEYSRAELKAVGTGTAKITFYAGSKKITEGEIRVGMSAKALKDNADLRMIQNAVRSGQDILSDYSGMDRAKIAVIDTTLNSFSDIYGSIVKNLQQEFGIIGDDLDLAEDEVIKEVLKDYYEYKTPVSDKEKKVSKAWKIIKTGMNDAKQLYNAKKNKAAERAAKSTIKAATKLSETKIDKIFKAFKGVSTLASEGFTLYEISATAIMLSEFEKDTVLELMNSFPDDSSAYQALSRLYADMSLSPDEYIIKNYVSEKMVDLVKKCFETILVQGEAPIKVIEAVASTLALIYDYAGGITVKQFDEATVATTIAAEAYTLFSKNNDSSKRKLLFCFLKSAISVELDKCISVCKTGSDDLKYNAEYYQRKVKALNYEQFIADCVKEYNDPESVSFENPDLERYAISARIKVETRGNIAPVGIGADDEKELIIPSSTGEYLVTSIADNGFENATGFQTLYLPDTVTKIGRYAFSNCTDFITVYSGLGIKEIDDMAFMGCSKLENVTAMPELESIGTSAFENCSTLSTFTIGKSVTVLGDRSFAGCTDLSEVYILNESLDIPEHAFDGSNVKIYGYAGSTAEKYANKHGLAFSSLGAGYLDVQVVFNSPKRISVGDSIDISLKITRSDGTEEILSDGISVLYSSNYQGLQTGYVLFDQHYVPFEFYVDSPEISHLYLNDSKVQMIIGDRYVPEVSCYPKEASPEYYNLSADDETIVRIEDNEIIALKEGSTNITVSSPDGTVTSDFMIEVSNSVSINFEDGEEDAFVFIAPEAATYRFSINSNYATGTAYVNDGNEIPFVRKDNEIEFSRSFEKDEICLISIFNEETVFVNIAKAENSVILGDVDFDNEVEIRDATWIQRHVAEIDIPFTISKATADVDCDDNISVMDATAIQYYLAHMKNIYHIGEAV